MSSAAAQASSTAAVPYLLAKERTPRMRRTPTASVTVLNPKPGGGTSNVIFFPIGEPKSSISMERIDFPAGPNPIALTLGDFNNDGKLDLAVADGIICCDFGYVSILLGNGDGTFQAAVAYGVGRNPFWVTTADFNGDGKLDLATANYLDGTISILIGNGDGTFQSAVNYAVGVEPSSIAVGDFNADGKLDLAVSNAVSNSVSILLGNGDGTFAPQIDYAAGTEANWIAVGDFNGDGKLDLAVANFTQNNTISILLGNGDGSFQPPVSYGTGSLPYSILTADLNGDGKLDLAVTNAQANTLSVLIGNGDGSFQQHVDYPTGSNPSSIAVGDVNGDGHLDLVTGNHASNTASLLLGNGDGTFRQNIDFSSGSAAFSVAGVAIADFNGDGSLDLAVANEEDNTVSILTQPVLPGFTVQAAGLSPSSVSPGGSAVSTITITPVGGFNVSSVSLACNISPTITSEPTCSFTSLSGGSSGSFTSTLTVNTIGSTGLLNLPHRLVVCALTLPLLGLVLAGGRLSRLTRRKLLTCLLVAGMALLANCGGGNGSSGNGGGGSTGTPAGTYTITITGAAQGASQQGTPPQIAVTVL